MKLRWADLHNHNEIGYGQGSLERSYRIAKGSLLDIFAFTPHGNWKDMPGQGDAKVRDDHAAGYARVRSRWREIVAKANAEYVPGRFVSFLAFETHSSRDGDYHVLLPSSSAELLDPESAAELSRWCRLHGAIMIPHHVAYNLGWRGANPAQVFPADVMPVICSHSEHGNSMEADSPWPYIMHSMGGVERSQTVMRRLQSGLTVGVVASTDNHHGHPASYGEGLAGVWVDDLTREGVLDAIRKRRTIAVSGDRIGLEARLDGAAVGSILPADSSRTVQYWVDALGPVECVKILKNGCDAHIALPPKTGPEPREWVVRVEFGWGGMRDRKLTLWNIAVEVEGGCIAEVCPCFAGGDGSISAVNEMTGIAERSVSFSAFTSRLNALPTSAVVLKLCGSADTVVSVSAESDWGGAKCGGKVSSSIGELLTRDSMFSLTDAFSAPKLKLGGACGGEAIRFAGEWTDPAPGNNDFYVVRVLQKNRHIAYSSPIWCRAE